VHIEPLFFGFTAGCQTRLLIAKADSCLNLIFLPGIKVSHNLHSTLAEGNTEINWVSHAITH
jgi:hypothetical protein